MARHFTKTSGTQDQLYIPNSSSMNTATGCLAFWILTTQPNDIGQQGVSFIGRGVVVTFDPCLNFGLALSGTGSIWCIYGNPGTPSVLIQGTTVVNDGKWHHVAANWSLASGTVNSLYVDGVLDASFTAISTWTMVAGGPGLSFFAIGGTYGEIVWYNAQLSASEIKGFASGELPSNVRPGAIVFYLPLWN